MNKVISMDEMVVIIKEQLKNDCKVEFTPKGFSMYPMLRDNKDTVVIEKQTGPLKKYDLPLYQRSSGKYVLHRVVGVKKDGSYIMCGDNQLIKEHGITDENIIGVVNEFERNGKRYSCTDTGYKIYCRVRYFLFPIRKVYRIIRHYLGMLKRKIIKHD